jgi:hypothetical protein
MDKDQFWKLIEDAKAESGGECEVQVEILMRSLMRLPLEEIIAFDEVVYELRDVAYIWKLWGAGYLINGLCSDDGFEYFRCWLIAQGQMVFEAAVKDADSLADYVAPDFADAECEDLLYVASHAYEQKMGREMPEPPVAEVESPEPGKVWEFIPPEPAGKRWANDEELDALLPRLVAMNTKAKPEEL